jgi:TonB family protein
MLAMSGSLAASIVAKATVAAALGLVAARLARGSRAAVRHALLAAVFGVLLALPVASVLAPPLRIAVQAAAAERIAPAAAGSTDPISPIAPAQASVASVAPPSAGLSLSVVLLTGWMAGMALFLLPVVVGLWQVRWLRRSALPWQLGQSVVERLARDAGIHRRVEVLLHEALPGPMTCGVVHPAIVLSPEAQTWEAEDLNCAILHELEHVRRADWMTHCLARAVCAVYWFHPLVWIAWRRLALEAERSCDDAVLGRSEATAYANQLVELAQRISRAAKSPILAMANRSDLAARVGAVLDTRQRRGRAGTFPVALACAAAAVLVLTMSPLRTVAAPQSASADAGVAPAPRVSAGAMPVTADAPVPDRTGMSPERLRASDSAVTEAGVVAAPQSASADARVAPVPRFSAETALVIVNVTAADKDGKSVEGLSASDFVVTDEGAAQAIRIFEFQKPDAPPQGTQNPVSSDYILGYYTANQNADRQFRRIQVTSRVNTVAKLNYRDGYYTSFGAGLPGGEPGGADSGAGPGITSPLLLKKFEPEYSDEARKAKFSGTVILAVEIDASGQVTNVKVNRSLGLGLDEKAVEAVRQWKFSPGRKDGKPVSVQAQVVVTFRLL